jgi:ribosomal protein S18 acetylase RimI-like enzyme
VYRSAVLDASDDCRVHPEALRIGGGLGDRRASARLRFSEAEARRLYLGKLAVSEKMRGQGCARRLVDLAAERARMKGLDILELETRIELQENHETFRKLGFVKAGEGPMTASARQHSL